MRKPQRAWPGHRSAGLGLSALLALLPLSAPAQVAVVEEPTGEAEAQANAVERHQVAEGETLSTVAERYLGDGDAWPRLWSYNPDITNPHYIYPGHVLKLRAGLEGDAPGQGAAAAAAAGANGGITAGKPRSGISLARGRGPGDGSVMLGEQIYLDRDALKQSARIVGAHEDHLWFSPSDVVYLQFKDGKAPSAGQELTVFFRQHREELGARAHKLQTYSSSGGEVVRVMGALKVQDYDEKRKIARAVVVEALEPLERGFEVTDVPRRLAQVAPKKNARDLELKILAATRPLGTLGENQLVFLDAGAKKGVEVGNRLWVVRQGDTWRQQLKQRPDLTGSERPDDVRVADDQLPPEQVAELRVIYVRPDSATALITRSDIEVSPGERVQMRAGY